MMRFRSLTLILTLALITTGGTAEAGRGGPDGGGWGWADADDPAVDSSFETPSVPWTVITTAWADDQVYPITLSFPFTFYGVTTSTVWISSNGWISFVNPVGNSSPINWPMPTSGAPDGTFAFFWDDLASSGVDIAQHAPTANGHVFLLRYSHKATGEILQFWVQLYTNGSMKVVYVAGPALGNATIGIEDENGQFGTQIVFDGATDPNFVMRNNQAILFYPLASPDCSSATPIGCPQNVNGTTIGGLNAIDRWGCGNGTYTGNEAVYSLTLGAISAVDIVLSGFGTRNMNAFLIRDTCDGTLGCIVGGGTVLNAPMVAAGDYFVVIDGVTPADNGAFNLDIACSSVSTPITCNSSTNTSPTGPSAIDRYDCLLGDYSGPETIFSFSNATTQTVTATITPAAPFDLILADQQTLTPVISVCTQGTDDSVAFLNLPPGDYALIVDGPVGSTGNVTLQLDCVNQVPATPIDCGMVGVVGSNPPASMIDSYPGCSPSFYTMGEAFYRFNPTGRVSITATSGNSADYDLFAFRESDAPNNCLAAGNLSVNLANLTPEDYLFVLDSGTRAGTTALSLACSPMTDTPLGCNTTLGGTLGATNVIDNYTCRPRVLDGGEVYFSINNPITQGLAVAVTPTDPTVDLDIIIFDQPFDTAVANCTAGGDRVARWDNAPPGDYLIVVDGPAASNGATFTLTSSCGASALSCTGAPTIGCNDLIAGDTSTGVSNAAIYGFTDDIFTGPELVFHFNQPGPASVPMSFILDSPSDPRLDLMIASSCDPNSVFQANDTALIIPNLAPGDYYIIVDGREGVSGTFNLVSFCAGGTLDPPVLSTALEPGQCYIETKRLFFPPTVPEADIMFSYDLSGSMGAELNQMKANTRNIFNGLTGIIPSLQFGLASFVEYQTPYTDTVCGVSHSPSTTAWAFNVHQTLTPNITQVDTVLQTIVLQGGAKETYTRTFYEAYTNPDVGWRQCSRRLWLSFGDEPAVDCNFEQCIGGTRNTGRDPGPDLITGTADDLELIPTVDEMANNGIVLIPVESSENQVLIDTWDCLAQRTGGRAFVTDRQGQLPAGVDIVDSLVRFILDAVRPCPEIQLIPTGPNASWATVTPSSVLNVITPYYGEYTIQFCVPPGTPPGPYSVPIEARCLGAGICLTELIATQDVTIDVTNLCPVFPVPDAAIPPDVCVGDTVRLDASASTACGPAGLRYRWLDGAVPVCPWSTTPTCDVVPTGTTTYTLEVECVNSPTCVGATSTTVTVHPFPIADVLPLAPICIGDPITVDATQSDPNGCPVPLEYQFSDGATVLQPWSTTATYGPTAPGGATTYTVEIRCTATPGCAVTMDQSIDVVLSPIVDAGPDVSICELLPVTVSGGASQNQNCPGGLLYEWREGATVVRPFDPNPDWTPPNTTTGIRTYTLVVRCDSAPGCEATDDVVVTHIGCALDVDFDWFDAVTRSDASPVHIAISWATVMEEGTLGFLVERAWSASGPFTEIGGWTDAKGSGSRYELLDESIEIGLLPWYRIIEFTGTGRGDMSPPFQAHAPVTNKSTTAGGRQRTGEDGRER